METPKIGSKHWNKDPPKKSFKKSLYQKTYPFKGDRSKFIKCPGCHSDMSKIEIFGDGMHDLPPDVWFHCRICGEEGCVDLYGDTTLDGGREKTRKEPYNFSPLPLKLPITGTPDQIRQHCKLNNIQIL